MDNNNSFDWVAVQMQNGNKSFGDLNAMGVDPSNTTLQSADFYKNQSKIKDIFKNPDGTFDNDKFNTFYTNAAQTLNNYKKSDASINNATTDVWADGSISRNLGMSIRNKPVTVSLASKEPFTALKQAQGSFYGMTEINKWTKPTRSIAEVAQGRTVVDGTTGKALDYTPEDTNLFNLFGFFKEPLVLASYDDDVKDPKGKVIHKKGEYKFDDKGLPFYETLAGRDPSGKQILSRLDTLTKEGSYANKFDFFDSDDLKKSITGSIVKAAVQAAPMLIGGPLSTAYTAYYIASGLTDASAQILKTIDGLVNGASAKNDSLYKWANSLQGYTGQWKAGMSEYGKDNFFSLESLLGQAVDSLYQLKSQKAIVQWPVEFTKWQMAKKLGIATESALDVGEAATKSLYSLEPYVAKYGTDWVKSAELLSNNVDKLHQYETYAQHISRAYMAATSAVGISQASQQAGLDARDQGFLYLGYTAALYKLFGTEYAHFVEHRIGGLNDFAKGANSMLKTEGGTILPSIVAEIQQQVPPVNNKAKALGMLAAGKNLAETLFKRFNDLDARTMIGAAAKEGFEEMTEQSIQNALQVTYNGLSAAGLTSTQDKQAKFDTDPIDMAKDIAMNGIGGVLGGVIFHIADPGPHGHTFKSDKLIDYVIEGLGDQVKDRITEMKQQGQFGDRTLSMTPLTDANGVAIQGMYEPVNDKNPISQNDFIADNLSKTITVLEQLKQQFNVINPAVSIANKARFYQNIVDPGTDTDYRQQLNQTITDIFKKSSEISSLDGLDKETDEGMTIKKAELRELQKRLEYLQGDESLDEFFVQGLFNIRTDINEAFGVKNRETIAREQTGKEYTELTGGQKTKVDELYNTYKDNLGEGGLRDDLKQGRMLYAKFDDIMESKGYYRELDAFKESVEHLNQYVIKGQKDYIPEGENEPVARGIAYQLTQDYLAKLQGVRYVPDYIFNLIKSKVNVLASLEAKQLLVALTNNEDLLKRSINTSLRTGLENPFIKEYVKNILGDKVFTDLTSSEEYKDLINNKVPKSDYSTLSLLKQLVGLKGTVNTSNLDAQRQLISQIDQINPDDIFDMLDQFDAGEEDKQNPAYQYFNQFDGLFDHIETLRQAGLQSNGYEQFFDREGLNKFIYANHIEKAIKRELTNEEREKLINSIDTNNIFLSFLTGYEHGLNDARGLPLDVIHAQTIATLDDTLVRQSLDLLNDFDAKRLNSPLRDAKILEDVYSFVNDQTQNMETVGISNYLNADPSFIQSFDDHQAALKRVYALVGAAATMNPIINDFRSAHKGMIGEENKDKVLNVLDDGDTSTLQYELQRTNTQLNYLRDVNTYNVNNVLQKLLKEDGFELVQKVNALRDISMINGVTDLIPSLLSLPSIAEINNYTDGYKTATEEEKFDALYNMAKFEHDVFTDVQKLSRADKTRLVNLTFTPINTNNSEFYDVINPENDLSDSHRTIYLAGIYGSSTLEFYKKYAGEEDTERGVFANLDKSPYIPFAKQESAVRLFDLVINGDRDIIKYLRNAYSWKDDAENIDFSNASDANVEGTDNLINILGSPGTGKTSAVLAMIMNIVDNDDSNTVILAPKDRQLNGLRDSLVKAGFESRIDPRSDVVKAFLQSLGLKTKDGIAYDFKRSDDLMELERQDSTDSRNEFFRLVNTKDSTEPLLGILDNLDIFKNGKMHESLQAALSNIKLIVLDEFTHVNPIDIAILTHLIDSYNNSEKVQKDPSKRIGIVNLGDNNQMGFVNKYGARRDYSSVTNSIITQPLLTSLRTGWDLLNNTMVDVTRRTIDIKQLANTDPSALESSDTLQQSRIPIQLFNYTGDDGSIGIKSINSKDGLTANDISFISDNKDKLVGKDVVYVVKSDADIPRAQALLAQAFGADWASKAHIEIYKPDEVQGGEYKYAIIDAEPNVSGSINDIIRVHEFLNTMLSRATEATLLVNNGSMSNFVNFENNIKDRAIKQVKINDDIIAKVKANKQRLYASILRDYVSPGFTANVSREKGDGRYIPVVPLQPVLFNQPPAHIAETSAKVSNIIAYTTFNTKDDFNNIAALMNIPGSKFDESKDKMELTLNSLKYYIMKSSELGQGNIDLASNFKGYLANYNYDKPKFYIEARKMSGNNILDGRSEEFPDKDLVPNTPSLYLKVKLDNNIPGNPPMVLTMGLLNSLVQLNNKYLGKSKLDQDDNKVQTFVKSLGEFFAGRSKNVLARETPVGSIEDGVWTSKEFTQKEFNRMAEIWGSRMKWNNANNYPFNRFKQKYSDYYISEPQVVVASMRDENNNPILDPDGKNKEFYRYWKQLQGSSVAFMSEYKELQRLSPDDILKLYIKQIGYFNNDQFKNAPALDVLDGEGNIITKGKRTLINEITEQISIPNVTVPIRFKPNMIQMIRLDNPRDSFINFRERYLTAIASYKADTPIQELFERFDMTPYVKDRLAKSLITIRKFLDTKEGKDYFATNILNSQSSDAAQRIEQIRQYALEQYGETGDFDQPEETNPEKPKHDSWDEVVLDGLGPLTSTEQFIKQLDELLALDTKDTIFSRKFTTADDSNARVNRAESSPIVADDLNLTLTSNKQVDFSKSILDLNLLNLFKKTKNLNFAEVLDKAFKQFADLPKDSKYDKYRLNDVFKDGQIETMVIANNRKVKGNNNDNILADVKRIGSSFTFGFGGLQQAAYNIDFTQVIDSMLQSKPEVTADDVIDLDAKVVDRYNALAEEVSQEWLDTKFGDLLDTYEGRTDPESQMETLLDLQDVLDNLNDTVRVPLDNENLTPESKIAVDISPNGIVARHTVTTDVIRQLTESYAAFKGMDPAKLDLTFQSSTPDEIVFKATDEDGNVFDVTYYQKDRSIFVERFKYNEQDPIDEFKDAGDGRDPKEIMNQAAKKVAEDYLQTGRAAEIATMVDLKDALGKELANTMSDSQRELLDPSFSLLLGENPYRRLFDMYAEKFYEKDDWLHKMLDIVHANITGFQANALSLSTEENPEEAIEQYDPQESVDEFNDITSKTNTKETKIVDPMELIKKDLTQANNTAKKEFEIQVRTIFAGAQNDKPVKDWVSVYEQAHRASIVNKILKNANEKVNAEHTLASLGILPDLANIDVVKLMNDVSMAQQKDPAFKALRKAFAALNDLRIQKTKQC